MKQSNIVILYLLFFKSLKYVVIALFLWQCLVVINSIITS